MKKVWLFFQLFWYRFQQNKLSQVAGSLTYSTMLAIVPLVMVIFSVFTAFPMFAEATESVKAFLFTHFAPAASDAVGNYIDQFVGNAKKMSAVGLISLIMVALMLIQSIDSALNAIWQTKTRNLALSMAVYWTILTLSPVFIGTSIAINGYISSISFFEGELSLPFGLKMLSIVPFILTWLCFTFIYALVPNTKIQITHAAFGALVAAGFFTLGKQAFIWYIVTFPSYEMIYGAMATLPLMLLWIQLSWLFVLLGAQLAAVLGDMQKIAQGELSVVDIKEQK